MGTTSKTHYDASSLFGAKPILFNGQEDRMVDVESTLSEKKIDEAVRELAPTFTDGGKYLSLYIDKDWYSQGDYTYAIRYGEEPDEPQYILEQGCVGCIPKDSIIGITGQQKSCKTHFALILVAAMLRGEYLGFSRRENIGRVLWFDLEQSRADASGLNKEIRKILESDKEENYAWDRYVVFSLKTLSINERFDFIERCISREKPKVVVIDGLADIVKNKNDEEIAAATFNRMEGLSKFVDEGITFICMMHDNPSDKEGIKVTGSLGSWLGRKATEIYRVRKNNEWFEASVPSDGNRHISINPVKFKFGIDGYPVSAEDAIQAHKDKELQQWLKDIFEVAKDYGCSEITQGKLVNELCEYRKNPPKDEHGISIPHKPFGDQEVRKKVKELGGTWLPLAKDYVGSGIMYSLHKVVEYGAKKW